MSISPRGLHRHLVALLAVLAVTQLFTCAAAQAQTPTKIFVASYGNDANDGSRGNPKRNFQAAHNAVTAGGQIVVLDTAGYGALNISKSLTITTPPGVNAFVTTTLGNSGISISVAPTDIVTLRGLIVEGGASKSSTSFTSGYGIVCGSVGSLVVQDCTIRNFYSGIFFFPDNNTSSGRFYNLDVTNCRRGIDVEINGSTGSAFAQVATCRLDNNFDAIFTGGTGNGTSLIVKDCFLTSNSSAIHVVLGAFVLASNCTINNNVFSVQKTGSGTNQVSSSGNNVLLFNNSGSFDVVQQTF
jgi:hypothetical protein